MRLLNNVGTYENYSKKAKLINLSKNSLLKEQISRFNEYFENVLNYINLYDLSARVCDAINGTSDNEISAKVKTKFDENLRKRDFYLQIKDGADNSLSTLFFGTKYASKEICEQYGKVDCLVMLVENFSGRKNALKFKDRLLNLALDNYNTIGLER